MARGRSSDPPAGPEPSSRTEQLLTELPDLDVLGLLHGSSNYTFLARLEPHPPAGLLAVYKPARGESPLWDFEAGTLYRREVAAYELSKVLGWPRIPPTVVREKGPHGIGALQLFIDADRRHFLDEQSTRRPAWAQVALFDVIVNNADRKSGHCLFDANDEVWVIDHGLTFNVDHKLRTVIWDFSGEPLPPELCDDVDRALAEVDKGHLGVTLGGLLSPAEVRMLKRRLRGVLDPSWRFPEPTSAWSIPWPPV
ncbi:MAG TPA: SCO1664 family protein [Candidatus Acidoferrum sp.]|nr:SCO1664 family protein [Candidatus Acidoferrum sp.]